MMTLKTRFTVGIKGVTAEARARAKAAAKRDGLTMGAWLSQTIENSEGTPPTGADGAPLGAADIAAQVDALEARVVALAAPLQGVIAQLSARLAQLEERAAADDAGPTRPSDTAPEA